MLFILNYYAFFCGFKCSYEKNRDFASGSGTNAENIINILKKQLQHVLLQFYKTTLMQESLIEFKNTMCQLKFSPKHNYLKSNTTKLKY
jgi:hypothetical protein